jgi:glutathione synthase/RimK-type ligase-like ATP-grasp enzyme
MKVRIVPYKPASNSAKKLAQALSEKLGYKVWRGKPKPGFLNVGWGNRMTGAIHWVNSPLNVAAAHNKLIAFDLLQHDGVSIPKFTTSKEEAAKWLADGSTVLARTAKGQGGSGIQVVKDGEDLPDAELYTQYIKKKKEFRVHVFKGKAILVQEKRKKKNVEANYIVRSHNNGWVFCTKDIHEPDGLRVLGVAAVASLGLDFGAVDIIWNEKQNKCFVLEVNSAPGLCPTTTELYCNEISSLV